MSDDVVEFRPPPPNPTIGFRYLKGWVPVRLNGRLELIDGDY
jgi:hypothetical protein